jgi:hypothetical protein
MVKVGRVVVRGGGQQGLEISRGHPWRPEAAHETLNLSRAPKFSEHKNHGLWGGRHDSSYEKCLSAAKQAGPAERSGEQSVLVSGKEKSQVINNHHEDKCNYSSKRIFSYPSSTYRAEF